MDARFRKLRAHMDVFYRNVIDQHREDRKTNPILEGKKTLLDEVLEHLDSSEHEITEENIIRPLVSVLDFP